MVEILKDARNSNKRIFIDCGVNEGFVLYMYRKLLKNYFSYSGFEIQNELINLVNGEELIYKDLAIKSMNCTNSEFDDNPEIKAYIQVKDLTNQNKDNVFVFNGWMFSSSPSIEPFDHPVYDIWLVDCY